MAKPDRIESKQSPTESLRHDLVKLRSDCANHYAKSHSNDKEMFAFAKLVSVFAIGLEPYTDKEIIKKNMQHYNELKDKIKEIKQDAELDTKNKEHNIIRLEFEFAEPIYQQSLRIFHNSPLLEYNTEGILNPRDPNIRAKIQDITRKSNITSIEGDYLIDELPD